MNTQEFNQLRKHLINLNNTADSLIKLSEVMRLLKNHYNCLIQTYNNYIEYDDFTIQAHLCKTKTSIEELKNKINSLS